MDFRQAVQLCLSLIRLLAEAAISAALLVFRESVRLSGSRQEQLASWTKDARGRDVPEVKLNLCVISEVYLQMLASGLGAIIVFSATVVVLGGFSTQVRKADFWFIAAIVFIETSKVVGFVSGPTSTFFVQVSMAPMLVAMWKRFGHAKGFAPVDDSVVPEWFAAVPIAIAQISLLSLDERGYGGSPTGTSKGNVKPALIFFYILVLAKGVVVFVRLRVRQIRRGNNENFSRRYFERGNGEDLLEKYVTHTRDKCIGKGVFGTTNSTMVSFAAELLQSEHRSDHASAVSVLHVLVRMPERAAAAVEQICSSQQVVGSLVKLLQSNSPIDPDTRACTAGIIAKLACKLRLTDIPGAAHSISSLLDPHLMKTSSQISGGAHDGIPLIVCGLVILGELAGDPGNCREMHNTKDLVPKIIAPISRGLLKSIGSDPKTVQIVKASLRVVAKLTRGTGESFTKLRRELSENVKTVENILWIMRNNNSDNEMRMLAAEILAMVTLGDRMSGFVFMAELRGLLFDSGQDSSLRISAGKALNSLAIDSANCEVLVSLMNDGRNSTENRAMAAELLAQICAKSTEQDANRLGSVSNALSMVLKEIFTDTTNMTELDRRKFLASFLGLAVQIREKLTTAEAFANTVAELLWENHDFSTKLKEIIEMSNDSKDEVDLVLMKAAIKLATRMMETGDDNTWIQYFRQEDIASKLKDTAKAMSDIERYVVLNGGADEVEPYETLQTLVERATNLASRQH